MCMYVGMGMWLWHLHACRTILLCLAVQQLGHSLLKTGNTQNSKQTCAGTALRENQTLTIIYKKSPIDHTSKQGLR